MMFTRYGTHWMVDEYGALWFDIDDERVERILGRKWHRWYGIDL